MSTEMSVEEYERRWVDAWTILDGLGVVDESYFDCTLADLERLLSYAQETRENGGDQEVSHDDADQPGPL